MDSKTVFELRKEAKNLSGTTKLNKLTEALSIAQKLYLDDSSDEWIQKALAWVLIDLCNYYITDKNINQSKEYFQQLNSINFQGQDEYIENQKNYLRPKLDSNYTQIQKANDFSRNGNHQQALDIFKDIISQNQLAEEHHESYGWIIYRYIKSNEDNLSSVEVRTFLRDYMSLKNKKPSMLHSVILNFALSYSRTHNDFNFYNFFLLWNPKNLRDEDVLDSNKDDKKIPSLISRICKEFVSSNAEIDVENVFLKNVEVGLSDESILDFFREPFFWNIYNTHKENKFTELWNLFEQYNANYSKYGKSKWHSNILNLAERFMVEKEEWRFFNFFKNWKSDNLRDEDWKEVVKDDKHFPSLAIRSIKKTFEVLKSKPNEQNVTWLIQPYEKAIRLFPDDEWLLRQKALLHIRSNELELATNIYKQLILELADKHYIWQEFSECFVSKNVLKIGMLSKALKLQRNEDFLGDIHLDLAKVLIEENLLENAFVELESYKNHREQKGWKLSPLYGELYRKTSAIQPSIKDNRELYKKYIPVAENIAYSDIEWTEVVLVDKWKDDKGKERLNFTDGKTIEFSIGKNRFDFSKQANLGQIFKFKLHKQDSKHIPLIVENSDKNDWSILEKIVAVIDYVNSEKNIVHAITSANKEVFFPQTNKALAIGEFVTARTYTKQVKNEKRTELREVQKADKSAVISNFASQIALVDNVNEEKQLFHYVINSNWSGIIRYSEIAIRPQVGDCLKLSFVTKTRNNQTSVKVLNIEVTNETNPLLRKDISGFLKVKFKNEFDNVDINWDNDDLEDEEYNDDKEVKTTDDMFDEKGKFLLDKVFPNSKNPRNLDTGKKIPDFGFIENFYVPKYLLEKHHIIEDCEINARIIYSGNKWKVIDIEKKRILLNKEDFELHRKSKE